MISLLCKGFSSLLQLHSSKASILQRSAFSVVQLSHLYMWEKSDKCKEIEGNSRMGKTRDLFKKIRDTKGTFHTKMGTIKDRNGVDLTEAEDN